MSYGTEYSINNTVFSQIIPEKYSHTYILSKNGAIINMRMRKKRHGNERLLALSSLFYPVGEENWVGASEIFKNDLPLKLEIGCGKGEFITRLSERDTNYNYIALERVADVAVRAVEKYANRRNLGGLAPNGGWMNPAGEIFKNGAVWDIPEELRGNVRFIVGEAADILSKMPENTLDSIIANFSDPWSNKTTYKKRRLTHPVFLENYKRVLKPDGLFSFKTDNDVLFEYTLEVLPESGFEIIYSTFDLHSSDRAGTNIVTEYESNFVSQGIKIKMLEARPK